MQNKTVTILRGGLIATLVMTLVMLAAPVMGMPKMLIGNMLANFMHLPLSIGWIAHFMIGTLIAVNYILIFSVRYKYTPILNGALFSLIPFFIAQIVVMPVMGAGIFSTNTMQPMMMVLGSLLGHLVYGATLGIVTGRISETVRATA